MYMYVFLCVCLCAGEWAQSASARKGIEEHMGNSDIYSFMPGLRHGDIMRKQGVLLQQLPSGKQHDILLTLWQHRLLLNNADASVRCFV